MRRIRSKQLWQYLHDSGALHGTEADIALAKREYVKHYKKQWRQNRLVKKIEIRPGFTPSEYQQLKARAGQAGNNPTTFVTNLVRAVLKEKHTIPNRDLLLKVLQALSIASVALSRPKTIQEQETGELLHNTELMLLSYLQSNE